MHEYSIVASLLDVCEQEARKHHAKAIKSLEVRIGRLSGIEPHFLQQCFDVFKEETLCEGATLILQMCDVRIACASCQTQSVICDNHFICPNCQSDDVTMIGGKELEVTSIEIIEEKDERV